MSNIKGIVIEIGADTTGLTDALKDVNKESKKIQGELREVERALKLDPGNTTLVAQKMDLLADAVNSTTNKLSTLRTAQSQVEAQFANGDIGEEQYRAFQRELSNTEAALRNYQSQMQSLQGEQQRFSANQRDLQTYLDATGQSVDDLANTLGTRLTNAIRDGSASADQLDQALNRIGRASGAAGQDLNAFRDALRQVDNGANLDQIRQDLNEIGNAANEAESEVKGFGSELASVAGGLAAGGGLAGAVTAALDMASVDTKIEVTMEIPEESKAAVTQAINDVTKYGVDGQEALEAVRRQWALNADATDEANGRIIEGAAAIAASFNGIDMIELVQETNEIAAALQITNEEALALTNSLLKAGFPPEQLDTIAEYGTQMQGIGFDAKQVQAIFEAGIDTKTWNIDNLNDGVKEARITMSEFGLVIDKAMGELLDQVGMSHETFHSWGKAVASGGEAGATAMSEVSQWLQTIEDDALRNELAIKVFGTKAEDQLGNMVAVFSGVADAQDKTVQNQEQLNLLVDGMNSDPTVQMKDAFNNMMVALAPILTIIADLISKLAQWAAENPALIATLAAIGTAIGIIVGAFAFLTPAIAAILPLFATGAAGAGLFGTVIAALTGPIGLAIAAAVAFGAGLITLWNTSEMFRTNLTAVFESIKEIAVQVFTVVSDFISEKINAIKSFWDENGPQILAVVEGVFNGIKAVVDFVMPAIQFVIEYVWAAIKNVISGALDVIMGNKTVTKNLLKYKGI